jgi:hypothetical protein
MTFNRCISNPQQYYNETPVDEIGDEWIHGAEFGGSALMQNVIGEFFDWYNERWFLARMIFEEIESMIRFEKHFLKTMGKY